jgi:hypothetical protein
MPLGRIEMHAALILKVVEETPDITLGELRARRVDGRVDRPNRTLSQPWRLWASVAIMAICRVVGIAAGSPAASSARAEPAT